MPPTLFNPRHDTPFKSSISSSQQVRKHVDEHPGDATPSSDQWPVPSLSVARLDSRHWSYLAEGGKNVLLRYDGPSVLPFVESSGRRTALRLRKVDRNGVRDGHKDEGSIDASQWAETILKPDLGTCCALVPLLPMQDNSDNGSDTRAFIKQIAAKIEPIRPIERRRKSGLDDTAEEVIYMTEDLSAGIEGKQVICIEVKPKGGFLPSGTAQLSSQTAGIKRRFSRYRMHRVLKSSPPPSLEEFDAFYDPLDLYSGDPEKVKKAAKALYSDWLRGEGNLHIVVNGSRAEGAEAGQIDRITKEGFSVDSMSDMFGKVLASKDLQDVLERLASLQAKYDSLDVEGVASLYHAETGRSLTEANEVPISLAEYQEAMQQSTTSTSRQAIVKLLLSTMYKDCSIFIRCVSGQESTIHLVDLDPKPVTKLSYLLQIDQDICRHFTEWARGVGLDVN